jgi:hypothetical protein
MGYPAPSRKEGERAVNEARKIGHAATFMFALFWASWHHINYLEAVLTLRVRVLTSQDCFNMSPGFSLLRLALLFAGASLLSGLNDCHLSLGLCASLSA